MRISDWSSDVCSSDLVDDGFDGPHFLVGNDKEVAAATGRVKNPDAGHAVAEIEKLAGIVVRLGQMLAKCVRKKRVQHFQYIRNGCVVHPQGPALIVVGNSLNHRPENVGVDLLPVEIADVEQVCPRDLAEPRHIQTAGKQHAVDVRKRLGPAGKRGCGAILDRGIPGPENLAAQLMGVERFTVTNFLTRAGERMTTVSYV